MGNTAKSFTLFKVGGVVFLPYCGAKDEAVISQASQHLQGAFFVFWFGRPSEKDDDDDDYYYYYVR